MSQPQHRLDRLHLLLSSTPGVVSDRMLALFGFDRTDVTRCRARHGVEIERVMGIGYRLVRKSD